MHGYHWKPTAGWNPRPWLSGCWKLSNSSARRQVRFVIRKSGLFLSYSRRHLTQIDIDRRYAMTSKRKLWTSIHLVTRKFIDYGTASLQTNRVYCWKVPWLWPADVPGNSTGDALCRGELHASISLSSAWLRCKDDMIRGEGILTHLLFRYVRKNLFGNHAQTKDLKSYMSCTTRKNTLLV